MTTPNPTAERLRELVANLIPLDLIHDRERPGQPRDAFEAADRIITALRARNLLSEGALSEESWEERRMRLRWPTPNHMRRTAGALNTISVARYGDILNHVADLCDGVTAAGVASQEPQALDPEKVAEVIEYYFDVPSDRLELIARALCEAYTEGKLR